MTDATPGMDANVSEGVQNHPKASHNSSSCFFCVDASFCAKVFFSKEVLLDDVLDDPAERIVMTMRLLLRDSFDDVNDDEEEEEEKEEEEMEEEATRRPKFTRGMMTFARACLCARDALWNTR